MTLDELTVKISVAADQAMAAIDGLIKKEQELRNAFSGSYKISVNTDGVEKTLDFRRSFLNARSQLDSLVPDFEKWLRDKYDGMIESLESEGVQVSDRMREGFYQVLRNAFSLAEFDSFGELETSVTSTLARLADAMRDPMLGQAVDTLNGYWDAMANGMERLNEAQRTDMTGAWKKVFDDDGPLVELLSDIPGITEMAAQGLMALSLNMDEAGVAALEMGDGLMQSGTQAENAGTKMESMAQMTGSMSEALKEQKAALKDSLTQLNQLGRQTSALNNVKKMAQQLSEGKKGGREYRDALKQLGNEMQKAGASAGDAGQEMGSMEQAIGQAEKGVQTAAGNIAGQLESIISWATGAQNSLQISGSASVNTGPAISSLNGLIAVAQQALAVLSALGVAQSGGASSGGKRGGGGGGGGKSAADKAEEERRKAIEADYEIIAHKRHMNEISFEEEIKMLDALAKKHQLNAEERMEWEEKVYDLKQDILERDAEAVDRLSDGVSEALERRYDAMRTAEMQRLEESRSAWEKWRDDSVRAIEEQIDALDRLAETEDREAKDAEELRKIEKLRQEILYEQDDFNREKLTRQLENAEKSREERLRRLQLEDEKAALEKEIGLIEEKAEKQFAALDEEEKRIEAYYEERLKAANIQAEAERLILATEQDQLLKLLYQYVPEYNALGQTLGEKLLDGFMSRVGNITAWFEDFGAQLAGMQESLAQNALSAADGFYSGRESLTAGQSGVVVNQSVNFNEPVESPAQVARRMSDVNDALGQLLA
ncbi:MAG: hypothetical protein J6K72_06795 [Clostridia bacterium]|nr:hypothetical protein [Clostridia bacterium]